MSTALETRLKARETLVQKTGDGPGKRVPDKTSRLCVTSSKLRLGDKSRTRHVCNPTRTHMLFMSLFLQTCLHVVNHLPRTSHHDDWLFKWTISSENENRHVGSCNENQTTLGTLFQLPAQPKSLLQLLKLASHPQILRPTRIIHPPRYLLDGSAQRICELRQQIKVHTLSTLTILCRRCPSMNLSFHRCVLSFSLFCIRHKIHFETIADSKYLAIDVSLCTPQTLVQLLTHNGL